MLHPKILALGNRILPRRVLAWLDPFQAFIDNEVRLAASRTSRGDIVLDAGAGEARHRKYFSSGLYLALDSGEGEARWDYSGLDIRGDLEAIPLCDSAIDRVLCTVVLEHTRNPGQVLREFARIMKPGAELHLVVPFLWEEHQAPRDYHRFTRYGVRLLFESLPFETELFIPVGGFFWVFARRCVNLLTFFQRRWRWPLFVVLAPFFGILFPVVLYFLDGLD
ncbi:MAG: methyltransferase domain-containing protein, partial [Acidobacteria bacterium]|nr:methyltransferase domain-containing protein [Acidobacteriota bacterium]